MRIQRTFARKTGARLIGLIDWIIEKNQAGYQMVNSVQRLQEMKAFVRMSSGLDLKRVWLVRRRDRDQRQHA